MIQTLNAAQTLAKRNRAEGLAALNELFRSGRAPSQPLNGRYVGGLVGLDIAPGITQLAQAILNGWLPWKGKRFDAATQTGDNILTRDSLRIAHVIWPLYRGYVHDLPTTYRAFTFRTYTGPGLFDTDRDMLKLDYNLPGNPPANVKRVLDEVVQLADGTYLGKAHLKLYWGTWKTVAFFSLKPIV